jgi:hypothetical protein
VRGPHSCCQTFTANISEGQDDAIPSLFDREEVSGQVAYGKDLTRDIEISVTHEPRRTKAPVDLRSLKDSRVQFGVILLER